MLLRHPEFVRMRRLMFALLLPAVLGSTSASADYRITRDHGGYLEDYKAKYARIRDRGERVVIDGICNSGCTVVARHRAAQPGLRHAAGEPRIPHGLFRQGCDRRRQGD